MIFFEHQHRARKRTVFFVTLFTLAILALTAVTLCSIYILLVFLSKFVVTNTSESQLFDHNLTFIAFLTSPLCGGTALLVLSWAYIGAFFKWKEIQRGGKAVVEVLGGSLIPLETDKPAERKILTVVEEMAIASGTPVPPVYLINDTSINALTIGNNRHDAVVAVTKGCMALLNREELQGVIAHEFSHIYNGDMQLNMRLIALLNGILALGIIGYNSTNNTSHARSLKNTSIIGLTFVTIGYIGTVIGNIIKAIACRKREFLADTSAVNYTRNPAALCSALKKIGALKYSYILNGGTASQFSHMFFSKGADTALSKIFATHPPLGIRIKRLDPSWNGSFENSESHSAPHNIPNPSIPTLDEVHQKYSFVQQASNFVSAPQPHHQEAAQILLSAIPEALRALCRNAFSSRSIIYALLLHSDTEARNDQLVELKQHVHASVYNQLESVTAYLESLPRALYLTVVDLCLPTLKTLSAKQYEAFKGNLKSLIQTNQQSSLFEWCLQHMVVIHCEATCYKAIYNITDLQREIGILFSMIVYSGAANSPGDAFRAGMNALTEEHIRLRLSDEKFSYSNLEETLNKLRALKPLQKPTLLKAIASIIANNAEVNIEQAELYRALGDCLDCPIPPIVV